MAIPLRTPRTRRPPAARPSPATAPVSAFGDDRCRKATVSNEQHPGAKRPRHARARGSSAIRLKEVRIDIARRQVAQIEAMITDLDDMAATLEHEIEAEQNRTGIRNLAHFGYSTLAKATIMRRDNLKRTITGLKDQFAVATVKLAEVSHGCQE